MKTNLNFNSHASFWCLKRFHDGLYGLRKTFWGTTKKRENRNSRQFLSSSGIGTGRVKIQKQPFQAKFAANKSLESARKLNIQKKFRRLFASTGKT